MFLPSNSWDIVSMLCPGQGTSPSNIHFTHVKMSRPHLVGQSLMRRNGGRAVCSQWS